MLISGRHSIMKLLLCVLSLLLGCTSAGLFRSPVVLMGFCRAWTQHIVNMKALDLAGASVHVLGVAYNWDKPMQTTTTTNRTTRVLQPLILNETLYITHMRFISSLSYCSHIPEVIELFSWYQRLKELPKAWMDEQLLEPRLQHRVSVPPRQQLLFLAIDIRALLIT